MSYSSYRKYYTFAFAMVVITNLLVTGCINAPVTPDDTIKTCPVLSPDYTGVSFPSNIAPPNFVIKEEGEAFSVEFGTDGQTLFSYTIDVPEVIIKERDWRKLQKAATGKDFFIRITVLRNEKWLRFADVKNTMSDKAIDGFLVYRLLYPGYELWNEMGIYQRDLTSYDETPLIENKELEKGCVNCHTFSRNSPENMMIHVRGKLGGTIIKHGDKITKVNVKGEGMPNGGAYAAYHPSGKYIAFSANEIQQFFHSTGKKPIEVSDLEADLLVYDVERNQIITDSVISGRRYMETFPNWSPDGSHLYYCRAEAYEEGMPLDSIRYNLYSVTFDQRTHAFGTPQCVYNASSNGKSVSFPRVSPDGKYLMFTQSDYGNFSIWHPESELCLITLSTGKMRIMDEVNSDDVESYHTWSSTGEWFVFSSKRQDGLWARPFIARFDSKTGKAGKPFVLPQRDPEFYDNFTKTFNLPELIVSPITDSNSFVREARNNPKQLNP